MLRFAAEISRRDRTTLDQDAKFFVLIANVAFDAFISRGEAKRYYDSARPRMLVRHFSRGRKIGGYLGPCRGFGTIPAKEWHPYSPSSFVTPPFPGYTSGHATASGAASKILELLTGSDRFECVAIRLAGEPTEVGCGLGTMQAREGVVDPAVKNDREVRLRLPTFSSTAEMAARSRMPGGYRIATDNDAGLEYGRRIAEACRRKYQAYLGGTAAPGE